MSNEPLKNKFNIILKRIFDISFSILFLLFFWWLYLLIIIAIKVSNRGPVIFKQKRRGKEGRFFYCYKFRTMEHTIDEPIDITLVNDKRVFFVGKFLRRYNFDELPQFFNVLKGEMSLVGPRPFMLVESNKLLENIENYKMRYEIFPGITGYAAIKGYRGGTEDINLMKERIDLDLYYIKNWSIFLDIKICCLTIIETFVGRTRGH